MKKYTSKNNTSWFTLLVILGVIGFLLILLTGIFKVVALELKDTKNLDNYIKSRSAAEASEELALLKIKKEGFWFDKDLDYNPSGPQGQSLMLSWNPEDAWEYHPNKDVFFWYTIDSKETEYEGTIRPWEFQVIPLFTKNTEWENLDRTESFILTINWANGEFLSWNIIGDEDKWGMSGLSSIDSSDSFTSKVTDDTEYANRVSFRTQEQSIEDFLSESSQSYLTLLNFIDTTSLWNPEEGIINYKLTTKWATDYFTKPVTTVIAQAKIWEIKQNIELEIDNSKYFDVLKYSIYGR